MDEVQSHDQLVPRALAVAQELSKKDKRSVGVVKEAVHRITVELLREGVKGSSIHSVLPNL